MASMDANLLYRSIVLNVAHNRTVQHLVTRRARSFAGRFVAGTTVQEALQAVDRLEQDGIHGILDLLGEMVTSEKEAERHVADILDQVLAFGARPYPRYVSIKLTQIGLDLNPERMLDAARKIAKQAQEQDCFLRIDMEDSPRIEPTLQTYRTLRKEGFDNVGLVLQSYLRRSADDLHSLLSFAPNLRIVKGAYKEPASLAFRNKTQVDKNYLELARTNLAAGHHTAIATHDESIIDEVKGWVHKGLVDPNLVEFQLLFGIRRDLQHRLASEGYRVRAYVPFGTQWYPYFSRRIAERPENALFIAKALIKG